MPQKAKTRFKFIMTTLSLLFFALLPTACEKPAPPLSIHPEIRAYTLAMSANPGIPLTAIYTRDLKNSDYQYHWVTPKGTFIRWDGAGSGRIQALGSDVRTNLHKVYWTLDPESLFPDPSFQIRLTVEHITTGEVIDEASLTIRQKTPGYFTIDP